MSLRVMALLEFFDELAVSIQFDLDRQLLGPSPTATARRLQRVLTADPGLGVARHADAGYDAAIALARKEKIKIPMLPKS